MPIYFGTSHIYIRVQSNIPTSSGKYNVLRFLNVAAEENWESAPFDDVM